MKKFIHPEIHESKEELLVAVDLTKDTARKSRHYLKPLIVEERGARKGSELSNGSRTGRKKRQGIVQTRGTFMN